MTGIKPNDEIELEHGDLVRYGAYTGKNKKLSGIIWRWSIHISFST